MRRALSLLAPIGLAILLALALWWSARGEKSGEGLRSAAVAHEPSPDDASPSAPELDAPRVDAATSRTPSAALVLEPAPDPPPVEGRETATCVLVGRVVDGDGRALADVHVRAQAFRTWTEGVDVPRLDGPYDLRGFDARTDGAGAFRVEAPVPTASAVAVLVRPVFLRGRDERTLTLRARD